MRNKNEWKLALNEVQQVITTELQGELKEGRYELPLSSVPRYASLRGNYNEEYPYCPVVVHNGKYTTDKYNSNEVLSVGFWESFDEEVCKNEWISWKQGVECLRTNKRTSNQKSLMKMVGTVINHNKKGLREGWMDSERYSKGMHPKGYVSFTSLTNQKCGKGNSCFFDWGIEINLSLLTKEDLPEMKELIQKTDLFWRDYERVSLLNRINYLSLKKEISSIDIQRTDDFDKVLIQPCQLKNTEGYNVLPIEEGVEFIEKGYILISKTSGNHWELGWSTVWDQLYIFIPGTGLTIVDPKNWVLPKTQYIIPDSDIGRAYTQVYNFPKEGGELWKYQWQLWKKYGIDFFQFVEDRSYNTTGNGWIHRSKIKDQCENCPVELYLTGGGGNAWVANTQYLRFRIK